MKALHVDGNELSLVDRPTPNRPAGEALLRVTHAGICNTDLELLKGYMCFRGVPGHEFVGVVEQCEDEALVGKRVVGEINCGCGHCRWCRGGDPRHCARRTVLGIFGRDGAFAEYMCLPAVNLYPLPDSISDENATLIEPLAACFEIVEQVHVRPCATVVILGDGKLAQLAARVLRLTAARLLVVGKHPEKLALLKGLAVRVELLADFKPSQTADIVVEATGDPSGFTLAMQTVTPRGIIVLKSTYAGQPQIDLAQLVVNETTVMGSRCGRFEPAIRALASGAVQVDGLISASYRLPEWRTAFEAARSGALKVVIRMPERA